MRIALRTSGGRGEYELAGHQSNIGASDILGRRLTYQLTPDLVLDGMSRAEHVQRKPRIRLEEGGSHIYRVLADVLLLPLPRRELREASDRPDFIRERCFVVQDIDIDVVRDSGIEVELRPTTLWLGNAVGLVRPTSVAERMQLLQGVWLAGEEQDPPSDLAVLVQHHTDAVTQTPTSHDAIRAAAESVRRFIGTDGDVLPLVAASLNVGADAGGIADVAEHVPAEGLEDETPPAEALRREIVKWRKQAERGAGARTFSSAVRTAYRERCAISGLHLPKLPTTASAGTDAAHILPWARFELNAVRNGICLSKHCHWAFDVGLIRIDFDAGGGIYTVSIPENVEAQALQADFDLSFFKQYEGPISTERLPEDPAKRPHPDYLAKLNELLFAV